MKEIMILNGAARKNGNTKALINAFRDGAEQAGNHVTEFYLQDMSIHGCMGCEHCSRANPEKPCVQQDDMAQIYREFAVAEVIVFASPLYYWTITGTLKTAADRLYGSMRSLGYAGFERDSVLLMTAGGSDYNQAKRWYETYERNLGWRNLGEVLGSGRIAEAKELGRSIE